MPARRTFLQRSLLLLALPLASAALLSGCGGPTPSTPAANTPAPSSPSGETAGAMKVGLVTVGPLTDSGWNSLAGKGLEQIKTELGGETSNQTATPETAEEALRGFARDGYKLVFAHGNEFGDAAVKVGGEFPETYFVVSSGEVQAPNVASLKFDLGEASYLAGMAAAGLSKSGKAGQIGGQPFPPVKQAFDLFEKGGQAVNPKFTAATTYVGNWTDANAAKEKALGMIRAGADVLFQNADAAGEGVFLAAEESKNVLVIGSNANQNDLKPQIIAASAVIDVPKTFLSVARDVKDGKFQGGIYPENLKSGNIYLALNPAFESKLPADVLAKIKKAEDEIRSGKLELVPSADATKPDATKGA